MTTAQSARTLPRRFPAVSFADRSLHLAAHWRGPLGAVLLLLLAVPASAAPLNVLFYGNSFTLGNEDSTQSVPALVAQVAVAAGHEAPNAVNAAQLDSYFGSHLATNTAVIGEALPPGGQWDAVVLQNQSLFPTYLGNLAQHRAEAVGLYQAVAAHSPAVVPLLYETWAYAPTHWFFAGPGSEFPGGPSQMQQELRDGYQLAALDINAAAGTPIAQVAPVGDAWEQLGYVNLHTIDLMHGQDRGLLLAALVIYSRLYNDPTTSDINLTGILSTLGLTSFDGASLAAAADAAIMASPVPEPSSLALAAGAAIGLASWRAHRRKGMSSQGKACRFEASQNCAQESAQRQACSYQKTLGAGLDWSTALITIRASSRVNPV